MSHGLNLLSALMPEPLELSVKSEWAAGTVEWLLQEPRPDELDLLTDLLSQPPAEDCRQNPTYSAARVGYVVRVRAV